MSYKKGFTIIELIVVIAIIAVLAAIVLVNVTQYINKSRQTAMLADLRELPTIAAQYFDENGSFAGLYQDSRVLNLAVAIEGIGAGYWL